MQTLLKVEPRSAAGGPRTIDAEAIDEAWGRANREGIEAANHILLDLSGAELLAHDTMLFIAGLLRGRSRDAGGTTVLQLPEAAEVLDNLVVCDFPELISAVTGKSLKELLTAESYEAVLESAERDLPVSQPTLVEGGGRENWLPVKHFAILRMPIDEDASRAAKLLKEHWLNRQILEILDEYLGGEAVRIATHIMQEAAFNAGSHPRARQAFSSSRIISDGTGEEVGRRLEIAIWDDGASFDVTLARALEVNGKITTPAFGLIDEEFRIRVDRGMDELEQFTLDQAFYTGADSEVRMIVAAFMLGTTSALHGSTCHEDVDSVLPDGAVGHGGIGLFLIRRTAIDLFGGTIRYITGRYRMEIKGAGEDRYDVMVSHHDALRCPITGNLLIVDIPLRGESDRDSRASL